MEDEEYMLKLGSSCPKCGLGKGLRQASALELAMSGWENWDFLHCDICGAYFIGRDGKYHYSTLQSPDWSSGKEEE